LPWISCRPRKSLSRKTPIRRRDDVRREPAQQGLAA
jgi:hypothetical protein